MSYGRFVSFDRASHYFHIDVDVGQDLKDSLIIEIDDRVRVLNESLGDLLDTKLTAQAELSAAQLLLTSYYNTWDKQGGKPDTVADAQIRVSEASIALERVNIAIRNLKIDIQAQEARGSQIAFVDATLELRKVKALHFITEAEEEALNPGDLIRVYAINRELDILYSDGVLIDDPWLQENGRFIHPLLQEAGQLFYNAAILPGMQRYKKIYREARIKNVDKEIDWLQKRCDVDILVSYSKAQALPTFTELQYFDVPSAYNRDAFLWFEDVCVLDFDLTTETCSIIGSHDGIYRLPEVWSDGSYSITYAGRQDVQYDISWSYKDETYQYGSARRAYNGDSELIAVSKFYSKDINVSYPVLDSIGISFTQPTTETVRASARFFIDADKRDFSEGVEVRINGNLINSDGTLASIPELAPFEGFGTDTLDENFRYTAGYTFIEPQDTGYGDYGQYLSERNAQNFYQCQVDVYVNARPVIYGAQTFPGHDWNSEVNDQLGGIGQYLLSLRSADGWPPAGTAYERLEYQETVRPGINGASDDFVNWSGPNTGITFRYYESIADTYLQNSSPPYTRVLHQGTADLRQKHDASPYGLRFFTLPELQKLWSLCGTNYFGHINLARSEVLQRRAALQQVSDQITSTRVRVDWKTIADGKTTTIFLNTASFKPKLDATEGLNIYGGFTEFEALTPYGNPRWKQTLRGVITTNASVTYPEPERLVMTGSIYVPGGALGHAENRPEGVNPLENNL